MSLSVPRVLAGLAAAVVLAGCGSEPAAAPAAPGADGFPRTVQHAMGSTTIPHKPARVVTLDTGEMDAVTLLGITPVGAVSPHLKTAGGFPSYLSGKLGDATDVGPLLEPNLEKITALHPDLIISSKVRHEKVYTELSRIAPTVLAETTGAPWKDNLRLFASALGLERQAADALSRYESRAHALGAAITARYGKPPMVSVVRFLAGPTRLYARRSFSGVVLADVGLPRPAAEMVDDLATEVGPELIDKGDADVMFVTVADDPSKTQQQAVQSNPLWGRLRAVRAGKVFQVPDETWMSGIGVQAANLMLDDIAKALGVTAPQ